MPPRASGQNKPQGPIPTRMLSPIQGSPTPSAFRAPEDGVSGYVEDVDPRFDGNGNLPAPPQRAVMYGANPSTGALPARGAPPVVVLPHSASAVELRQSAAALDSALLHTPQQRYLRPQPVQGSSGDYLLTSYDSLPLASGQRSPGDMSESSHFTSVSQRGVNPAWGPPHVPPPRRSRAGGVAAGAFARGYPPRRESGLLAAARPGRLPRAWEGAGDARVRVRPGQVGQSAEQSGRELFRRRRWGVSERERHEGAERGGRWGQVSHADLMRFAWDRRMNGLTDDQNGWVFTLQRTGVVFFGI